MREDFGFDEDEDEAVGEVVELAGSGLVVVDMVGGFWGEGAELLGFK